MSPFRVSAILAAAAFIVEPYGSAVAAKSSCSKSGEVVRKVGKIDIFLVAGQSNATGIPDNAIGSPKVTADIALQYYGGKISAASDPVGNAEPGSAWPSFGVTYKELTGRRALFVPASVPASSMMAAGDVFKKGHWDETGDLFDKAVTMADKAVNAAGPDAQFAGVLWDQGESDALSINLGYESPQQYKIALQRLIDHFRAHFGKNTSVFIFKTGATTDKNQDGFAAVRAAQVLVSSENQDDPIVFRDAVTFLGRGLMSKNGTHYTQAGYNLMGAEGAQGVAAYFQQGPFSRCE